MSDKSLRDFLLWFRREMENYWAKHQEPTIEEFRQRGVGGTSFRRGTQWKRGLPEHAIETIERKFGFEFPDDYRTYLSVLNAPDRGSLSFVFKGAELVQANDIFEFPDWVNGEKSVGNQLQQPLEGWLFDLEHDQGWFRFMGPKPKSRAEQITRVKQFVKSSPLLPVFGHRYMPMLPKQSPSLILSVHQTDVIPYGETLEDYLLREFAGKIGGTPPQTRGAGRLEERLKKIPVWGNLVLGN